MQIGFQDQTSQPSLELYLHTPQRSSALHSDISLYQESETTQKKKNVAITARKSINRYDLLKHVPKAT